MANEREQNAAWTTDPENPDAEAHPELGEGDEQEPDGTDGTDGGGV